MRIDDDDEPGPARSRMIQEALRKELHACDTVALRWVLGYELVQRLRVHCDARKVDAQAYVRACVEAAMEAG
jgi:hypothetical protein